GVGAFFACAGLESVVIPDALESIPPSAFAECAALAAVRISEDAALMKIGDLAFGDCVALERVYLPPGVTYMDAQVFHQTGGPARAIMFNGVSQTISTFPVAVEAQYDSYAAWWATLVYGEYVLVPSAGEMRSHPPDLMYKYIPYEFIAKTKAPDNAGLRFWLTDRQGNPLALPAGMYLADGVVDLSHTPGTIYGSPLDYTDFENGVAFTMHAQNIGGGFTAAVDFTVRLAPTPANAWLEANLNKYPLISDPIYGGDGHIGEWDAENGRYVIYGVYEDVTAQIFYIGDIMEGGALINSFERFDSFWLDGIKQEIVTQYEAEDGSTRVTILAQTIRDLDNGEHTAAAAFRRTDAGESADIDAYASWNGGALGDNLDVVAQNFTVNLSARPAPGGGDSGDGDGDSGDSGDSGVGDGGGSGGSGTGGGTSDDDNTGDTGGAGDSGTGDGDSGTGAVSGAGDGGGSGTGGDEIGGTGGAGGGGSGDSGTGEAAEPADLAGPAVPAVPALPVEAAGPAAPAEPAALTETAGGSDQGPDGGGPAVSGLPVDENGRFYFALDGSGAPLELRIDIPLEEFGELYFDGALWAVGPDYAVRSGSTVLTVAAGRLERYEAGIHSFTARFAATTVEISFTLVKSAVPPAARLPATEENAGLPLPAAAALALTFLAGGAIVFTRARKAKTVK
ncbi:MAG: leucine-rich repeat domain-containing protein, partial [Gracilibacteraceae bacterium]|nr:leucine-rich repeat domain-containing protein [Gracilibacteraceae bacterium]